MEDKTLHYTVAFSLIFALLLGLNQFVQTQEKKESRFSPALKIYTGASFACAAIGSRLPYSSPAAAALMRRFFLTSMKTQTATGSIINIAETLSQKDNFVPMTLANVGYNLYAVSKLPRIIPEESCFLKNLGNIAHLPLGSAERSRMLKRYATFCLISQALSKYFAAPAFCIIKKNLGEYVSMLTPEQLEETCACLSWNE